MEKREHRPQTTKAPLITILVLVGLLLAPLGPMAPPASAQLLDVIVQAEDMATAASLVREVGGTITHELGIIDAVGAQLTAAQLAALEAAPGRVHLYPNSPVQVSKKKVTPTPTPQPSPIVTPTPTPPPIPTPPPCRTHPTPAIPRAWAQTSFTIRASPALG